MESSSNTPRGRSDLEGLSARTVTAIDNLTRHEWGGLENVHNLADGHARHGQGEPELQMLGNHLPALYAEAEERAQLKLQCEFEREFYGLAGQRGVPVGQGRPPLHHYSSSLSIEVVANYIRAMGLRVGLLHPTFDNIPAILRRQGIEPCPVTEHLFETPSDDCHYRDCDALFLVAPNNPTGTEPSEAAIREIAQQCVERRIVLIIDFSFRFFSGHLLSWDQYSFFEDSGVSYIGIEDTGKTWPSLDLKVGSLNSSSDLYGPLRKITDDCLLNVSGFIFALLREYIRADPELRCRRIAASNRELLKGMLSSSAATVASVEAPMSVAWLELPDGWVSSEVASVFAEGGVSVLPGEPFFWSAPEEGSHYLRVALMRPVEEFKVGAAALAGAIVRYEGRHL